MHCHTLTLRAGQTGRLTFSITPEGDYALAGAVRAEGKDATLTANGVDLFIPALPPGLHLLEVRANGRTVMYGGLEVLPSPMEDASGEVAWAVHADLAETIASISITLTEGPQGPQGEKGEQGDPGPQGERGEQGEPGPAPTDEQVRQAVENALYIASTGRSTPEGTDNSNVHCIELDAQHVPIGKLSSLTLHARTASNPSTYSYLGLWELGEDGATWEYLGSSTNAPGQSKDAPSTWLFGGITLHGRTLRILPQTEPSSEYATGPVLGLRVSVAPEGDASRYIYNNSSYAYLPQLTLSYTPPAVLLTAEEQEGLHALLTRKEELFALLES